MALSTSPRVQDVSGLGRASPKGVVAPGKSMPLVHGSPPVPMNGSTCRPSAPAFGSEVCRHPEAPSVSTSKSARAHARGQSFSSLGDNPIPPGRSGPDEATLHSTTVNTRAPCAPCAQADSQGSWPYGGRGRSESRAQAVNGTMSEAYRTAFWVAVLLGNLALNLALMPPALTMMCPFQLMGLLASSTSWNTSTSCHVV